MATPSLNYFQRRALWEAYGKRCAYCGAPLTYKQLHIDHILPERLLDVPDELAEIRRAQDLPPDFDLRGYENLVPACYQCNATKWATPFLPGRTAIELGNARRHREQVVALVSQFQAEDRRDKLHFAIAAALSTGHLTPADLGEFIVRGHGDFDRFPLGRLLTWFPDEPIRELSKSGAEASLDRVASLPDDMRDGLQMRLDDGAVRRVRTLREYQEAVSHGFYAFTTYGMSVANQSFERPLAILRSITRANVPERSFISTPRCGLADISLLPASLLFLIEDMTNDESFAGERARLAGRSIHDLAMTREVLIVDVSSESITLEYKGCRTFMFELMRADFDGDGVEDMLIHRGGGPITGTYSFGTVVALSRRSNDSMFSEMQIGGE